MTLTGFAVESPLTAPASGQPAAPTWRDRAGAVRDRLYANEGFQRWAGRIPGVRWVARRRARALFDLVAGFTYTQTTAACVQTGLLTLLADAPQSAAAIASRLRIPAEGVERLLRAAAALDLVEQRGGERWGLGALGGPLAASAGLMELVEHNALLYDELRDPLRLLRRPDGAQGPLARYWPYAHEQAAHLGTDVVSEYSSLMSATVAPIAEEVLDAVSLRGARQLLDVGGGDGGFVTAVARRHPALRLGLFDVPAVADRARRRLGLAGLGNRVAVHGGDFQRDALPVGADVVTLVRICLDHDDATVRGLLARVREALPRGGRVIVAEPLSGVRGTEVVADVYFGFYLWAMGRGRARHADELRAMLHDAGFRRVREHPTRYPVQASVMVGVA